LGAGDLISIEGDTGAQAWRIDKVVDGAARELVATRVFRRVTSARPAGPIRPSAPHLQAVAPSHIEFLDLPLFDGTESPHAPYVAALQRPWAGPIAVYTGSTNAGYALNKVVDRPATIGELADPLPRGRPDLWMAWGGRVRLDAGALGSVSTAELYEGANLAALRTGDGDWEVIQFLDVELVESKTYRLKSLLRGQAGTETAGKGSWPAGATFVLLDRAVLQVELSSRWLDVERSYRFGPATVGVDHASYRTKAHAARGIGLRPFAPAHLAAEEDAEGNIALSWVRRTRVAGDLSLIHI
jgi:hypothetical protein